VEPQPGRVERDLRTLERAENFPVALRLLPRPVQGHLRAIYDTVRTIDDLSDATTGDSTEQLLAFREDLELIWQPGGGTPERPVLRRLVPTVRALGLPPQPFRDVVEAGLRDQRVSGYPTFEDLREYCRLSADPIGRLVLATFGVSDPLAAALSDEVCTALQLLEHWQDLAEDRRAGRIYLPACDMLAFDVIPADLDAPAAGENLRRLVRFETERATAMLRQGSRLVGRLRGYPRLAIAGYVAGGAATARALRRAEYDSLAATPRPRPVDTAGRAVRVALGGGMR
jgi:squalene synthase HpnC